MAGASSPNALHSAILDVFLKYTEECKIKQQIEEALLDERYHSTICNNIAQNS